MAVREPSLTALLTDPVVRMMMDADGVDPHGLSSSLTRAARDLRRREARRSAAVVGGGSARRLPTADFGIRQSGAVSPTGPEVGNAWVATP